MSRPYGINYKGEKMKHLKLIIVLAFIVLAGFLGAQTENPLDDFAGLMFFPALAVDKEDTPAGIATKMDFNMFKSRLLGGTIYMGKGSYTAVELAAIVDGMDHLATELAASYDDWGEVGDGDDAIAFGSVAAKLKTRTRTVEGKRVTTLTLKIVGFDNDVKDYVESANFNPDERTFVILADGDANDFAVLNGLNWVGDWEAKGDNLRVITLTAEWGGPTEHYITMYQNVSETAS